MIQGYASRTGSRRNLRALGAAGWRLLCEPSQLGRYGKKTPPLPYALDSGAWGCFQRKEVFCEVSYRRLIDWLGRDADWIVLPDIVEGGQASLSFSLKWRSLVSQFSLPLLAVQDGMRPEELPQVGPDLGIFVGGSTSWKLATLMDWGQLAQERGAYLHVGRVNSAKRIVLCQDARADSFDGTSATRFSCTLPRLDNARRQLSLLP